MQLASGQHGLQHIACIHSTLSLAGAYDQVKLINKQYDLSLTFSDFLQHSLQTLLKFSSVLGACYQGTHIQCENLFIF